MALPLERKGAVGAEAAECGGGEASLYLDDGANLMVLAAVGFDGVETGEDAGGDGLAGVGVEEDVGESGCAAFEEPGEDGRRTMG